MIARRSSIDTVIFCLADVCLYFDLKDWWRRRISGLHGRCNG